MAPFLVNGEKTYKLQKIKDAQANQRIGLFKSNTTPSPATVWSDLTEADFSGYARVTPTWGSITVDGGNVAHMSFSTATFAHNGGGTANDVYGWFLVDVTSGTVLLVAERWPSPPKTMAASGDSMSISFELTDTQA